MTHISERTDWLELADNLHDVPELATAFNHLRTDPTVLGRAVSMRQMQAELLGDIDGLNTEDALWSTHAKQQWLRGVWGSASDLSAAELHELAHTTGVPLQASALESLTANTELARDVTEKLHQRLLGGSALAQTGVKPTDGDPRSDSVIWGHTIITNPESLLAFVGAHLMCMYVAAKLHEAGVPAAVQKDYVIGAMIDAAIMRGLKDETDPVFQLWRGRKPEAFGWISDDRLRAFSETKAM